MRRLTLSKYLKVWIVFIFAAAIAEKRMGLFTVTLSRRWKSCPRREIAETNGCAIEKEEIVPEFQRKSVMTQSTYMADNWKESITLLN